MNVFRAAFGVTLGRRLPVTDGVLGVEGPERRIVVRRDRFGIPHIQADTDVDAWYGLGFCQGQDRSFQLELLSRAVAGTLSAILGPETLPVDRLSRRIGFARNAQHIAGILPSEELRTLTAFAAGINAGRRSGRSAHEFVLLRTRPGEFSAHDTIGLVGLQAFSLAANWDAELARLHILDHDGEEALAALDPTYPEWHPVTTPPATPAGPAIETLAHDLELLQSVAGLGGGSNNWAIAAAKTRTGRPILMNDPHLAPTLPSQWYLGHVTTPEWGLAGGFLTGTPTLASGHNGFAAWGVTAGLADNTDLFLEDVNGRTYREGNAWVDGVVHEEHIEVLGAEPVVEEVMVTSRGPIIGPPLEGHRESLSLSATWLFPQVATLVLPLHRIRSFGEFQAAGEHWAGPSLNLAYADVTGDIGWQLFGTLPVRRSGKGTLPLPGWAPTTGWEAERVTTSQLPFALNPDGGFVVTANNRPHAQSDGPHLGADWLDGYRAARIAEIVAGRDDWDVASSLSVQVDVVSLPWREMRDHVLIGPRPGMAVVHHLLEAWDGEVAPDSAAATVFELFVADMAGRVATAKAPNSAAWALGLGFSPMVPHSTFFVRRTGHLAALLEQRPEGWFAQPWDEVIVAALRSVEARLRRDHGDDPTRWTWGEVRPLTFKHPVGRRRPLDRVFDIGPFPWGGDANTVGQCSVSPLEPTADPSFAVASMRAGIDVGAWEHCRWALPSGQSGNPMSPHYRDMTGVWRRGDGVPIHWSPDAVEAATVHVLHLVPKTDA